MFSTQTTKPSNQPSGKEKEENKKKNKGANTGTNDNNTNPSPNKKRDKSKLCHLCEDQHLMINCPKLVEARRIIGHSFGSN